jgi:hypothetical protein
MQSVSIPLSAVPKDVIARLNEDRSVHRVMAAEKCFNAAGTLFYAITFEEDGQFKEALITPQAELMMAYEKDLRPPAALQIENSVNGNTDFRLFRLDSDGEWGDSTNFSAQSGLRLVKALEGARPWDGTSHVQGLTVPERAIGLDWSSDATNRKSHALWICRGNRLFWHFDSYYEVPDRSTNQIDSSFPENQQYSEDPFK